MGVMRRWNKGIMGQRNLEVRKSVNLEIHTSAVHEQRSLTPSSVSSLTSTGKAR